MLFKSPADCGGAKIRRKILTPARILVLGFAAMILAGAVLLSLPVSARSGVSVPFMTALFTSTSATCVTGLVVVDTASTWSVFGRAVILCLVQIGGLGFMSVTTIFFFVMHRKIGLSQRLLIVQSLNLHDMQGVIRLIRHVLLGTFLFEGLGALVLCIRFAPEYGVPAALGAGGFYSISAFCNSGFDLTGDIAPFSSIGVYSGDVTVTVTLMLLVFIGGIGFFVWEDIFRKRRFRTLYLHTKLALVISLSLILFGWIFFFFAERANPATMGDMTMREAVLASAIQSVMPRSCGFAVVDQGALTGMSRMMTMALMLIGGSAGSTAGGIKNVTVGILFLSAISSIRGRSRAAVFGRTIPVRQIVSALSIMLTVIAVCFAGSVVISFMQPELSFSAVLFETVSAVATCGLSAGATQSLTPASLSLIMLFMLFGRVGIMTFGMAAFINRGSCEKIKRPDAWVMMG